MGNKSDLLQGTLDLLILKTLDAGADARLGHLAAHPAGVRRRAAGQPGVALPRAAPARAAGPDQAEWGNSENNRQAKFYALTRAGRKQLEDETRELGAARGRRRARAGHVARGGPRPCSSG